MTIIHRYIAKSVIISTLLVTAVVLGLSFFINLLGEFRDIGMGDYGFADAMIHALLRTPFSLYQFFPMVALLGSVLGLSMLASHQELTVMRASGISSKKVIAAVILGTLSLILIVTLLGEWISPSANFLASQRKSSAQSSGQAVATASGVWVHEGDDFFQVKQVIKRDHLEGITRYQFDAEHHLLAAYYIGSMDYYDHHWILHNVVKTQFDNNQINSQHMDQDIWSLTLNPNLLTIGMIEPDEMSLKKLSKYSQHLIENGLQASEFQFTFWKRVFQPLATLVMILLAVPFVFNVQRSVVIGRRILGGVMVGFIFYIFGTFLGQLSIVLQLSPWMAALLPIILFASLGYIITVKWIN